MDKETRELVLNDYRVAQRRIDELLSNSQPNYRVGAVRYLNPIPTTTIVPLCDRTGMAQCFILIRAGLEAALLTGRIPADLRPASQVPLYINDLMED